MPEGRSWWRLPSGLWHASIFHENRPGQSEVRANTRASGVAGGGWKGVLRGAAAPSSTRLPLPGGRKSKQKKTAFSKQAERLATRQQKGSGGFPFIRLKDREPGCTDPLRPRAPSAPTAGSRAPSTPRGSKGGAPPHALPPFPLPPSPFSFPLASPCPSR